MRHLPTKPCEKCGQPTPGRIRRVRRWWQLPAKWHWFCVACAPAFIVEMGLTNDEIPTHKHQEYNVFGNTCHYPGCDKTERQHVEK